MASLKITNLNDDKGSEWSTKDVTNEVTQRMAAMQAANMPIGFGAGPGVAMGQAAQAHTGVEPYAGVRAMNRLQRQLPTIGQAPLPLEITNNPNYRPRV